MAAYAAPRPLKYLFLKDLAGNAPKNKPKMPANSLIYKYLACKSLFLKDLEEKATKSLIPKDRDQRGPSSLTATGLQFPHAEAFR